MRKLFVLVPLLGLLALALWFMVSAWNSVDGPPMPATGYVALGLGVFFSLVVGFGLMALIFYSSRHGYDEPAHLEPPDEQIGA